ncbi:hypothetical protein O3P69_005209 [Scylla paramamosain]|uniref:Uncharacterized protein n=1 Tax=Scylla paramamosain TaxID=85552 RepID=A0AAW0U9N4_SCYPA
MDATTDHKCFSEICLECTCNCSQRPEAQQEVNTDATDTGEDSSREHHPHPNTYVLPRVQLASAASVHCLPLSSLWETPVRTIPSEGQASKAEPRLSPAPDIALSTPGFTRHNQEGVVKRVCPHISGFFPAHPRSSAAAHGTHGSHR